MKKIILTKVFILIFITSFSQINNIEWLEKAEKNEFNNHKLIKSFPFKNSHYIVTSDLKNQIFLTEFNAGKQQESTLIENENFKENKESIIDLYDIMGIKNKMYIFYTKYLKKEDITEFYCLNINPNSTLNLKNEILLSRTSSKNYRNSANIYIHFNKDSSFMAVETMPTIQTKGKIEISSYLFNTSNFSQKLVHNTSIQGDVDYFSVTDFCIDNEGFINYFYKLSDGIKPSSVFYRKITNEKNFYEKQLQIEKADIYDIKFCQTKDKVKIIGLYSKNKDGWFWSLNGVFACNLNEIENFSNIKLQEYSKPILSEYLSESKIQKGKGIDLHYIRNIIADKNNDIFIFQEALEAIGEGYGFNNILITKINNNNTVVWDNMIRKLQLIGHRHGNSIYNGKVNTNFFGSHFYMNHPHFHKPHPSINNENKMVDGVSFGIIELPTKIHIFYNGIEKDQPSTEAKRSYDLASTWAYDIILNKNTGTYDLEKENLKYILLPKFISVGNKNALIISRKRTAKDDFQFGIINLK